MENVRKSFNKKDIYLVMGGVHLMETDARLIETIALEMEKMPVKKIDPATVVGKQQKKSLKKSLTRTLFPYQQA